MYQFTSAQFSHVLFWNILVKENHNYNYLSDIVLLLKGSDHKLICAELKQSRVAKTNYIVANCSWCTLGINAILFPY